MKKMTKQVWYNTDQIIKSLSDLSLVEEYVLSTEKDHPMHGKFILDSQVMILHKDQFALYAFLNRTSISIIEIGYDDEIYSRWQRIENVVRDAWS